MSRETDLDKQDKAEINNYTRTPNMLIFGYHDTISPQEKWLYVCLKHLCGKKGTRHLSLRYISEQTGISTGALSASKNKKGEVNPGMIKHLHNAGLIHAEIKKPGRGNPQYHITITEVWALNQAFFRSEFGQVEEMEGEPVRISDEPVQNSDRSVHFSDRSVQNSDEPVRNSANTNMRSKITEQDSYNMREQEESAFAPSSFLPQDEIEAEEDETPTVHRMPAITLNGAIASTLGEPDISPLSAQARQSHTTLGDDGAATVGLGSEPRASDEQDDEPYIRPETAKERKRRVEQREKEIWALVEQGLGTKFTRTQRQLKPNVTGMERLIEDDTSDETISEGLEKLSDFWKNQFDLAMFHAKLPGLVRKQPQQNGHRGKLVDKSPQSVLDAQYEAALQASPRVDDGERHSDFDVYVGNGPEARRELVRLGKELKARGVCPDL